MAMNRMKRYFIQFKKRKIRGQGLVEFALAMPVFLLLVLGVIEFGRLLAVVTSVTTAAREAARYGSAAGDNVNGIPFYQDTQGMRDAAKRVGFFAGIQDADVSIGYYDADSNQYDVPHPPLITPTQTYIATNADYDAYHLGPYATSSYKINPDKSPRVVVYISVNFKFLFLSFNPFPITSQSVRTIVSQVKMDVEGGTITPAPTWPPTPTDTRTPTLIPSPTVKHPPTHTPRPVTPTGPTPTPTMTPTPTNTYTVTPTVFPCGFIKAGAGILTDNGPDSFSYSFRIYNSSGVSSIPYYPAQKAWLSRLDLLWSSRLLQPPPPIDTLDPSATVDPNTPTPPPTPTATKSIDMLTVQFGGIDLPNVIPANPFIYNFGSDSKLLMEPGTSAVLEYTFNVDKANYKLSIEGASVLLQFMNPANDYVPCLVMPDPLVQGN